MANRDLNYYLNLPYTIQIQPMNDESGKYYHVTVLELDGCQSDGETPEQAYENIKEAMEGWIETKLEYGDPIPEPVPADDYSGKFVIRVPKSLHKKLTILAAKEGVSLNQYVLYKLSQESNITPPA